MTDFESLSGGNVRCTKHGVTFSENEFKQAGASFVSPCGCKMSPYGKAFEKIKDTLGQLRRGGGGNSA